MRIKSYISVTAVVIEEGTDNKSNIEIDIDKSTAAKFLFRFLPSIFTVNDYTVKIQTLNNDAVSILFYNLAYDENNFNQLYKNKTYHVLNTSEFLTDILNGFNKLSLYDNISTIYDYINKNDDIANEDDDTILDEFEDGVELEE